MLSIKDITIDAELESLLPPLSEDENVELLKSIQRDGFTDPIIVWLGHNILVDGHNRHRIWTTTGMSEDDAPEIIEKQFTSRDAVKEWMLRRQLARRNLTDAMRVMVALQLKPMVQAKAKEKQASGGGDKKTPDRSVSQKSDEPIRVDEEIAKAAGVSRDTVRKVEAVLEKADDATKADMLAGKTSIAEAHRKVTHVSNNSGNNEWYTPVEFVEAARSVLGEIDLDPASCLLANSNIKATEFLSVEDDGLSQEWNGRVWLNPPYSQPEIAEFARKVVSEFEAGRTTEAIVLVNNATETEWGQTLLRDANAVCFKCGRIKFLNSAGVPANTPLQGQMFVYFGKNSQRFVSEFSKFGVCLI